MTREEYHKELERLSVNIFDCIHPKSIWSIASLQRQLTIVNKLSDILEWMPKDLELRISSDPFHGVSIHGYHSYVQIYLPKWMVPRHSFRINSKKVLKVSLAKAKILLNHRINYLSSSVSETELVFLGKLLNLKEFTEQE